MKALVTYTESGGQGDPTFDTAQAIAVMLEKHGIACDLMHGFNWDKWTTGKPASRFPGSKRGLRSWPKRCWYRPVNNPARLGEQTDYET